MKSLEINSNRALLPQKKTLKRIYLEGSYTFLCSTVLKFKQPKMVVYKNDITKLFAKYKHRAKLEI